jgi:hypothetical protein
MSPEKESKYVSWTWIVSVLLGILMLIGGYVLNDTREAICTLRDNKMDRAEYLKDETRRSQEFITVNQKLDDLLKIVIRQSVGDRK